MTSFKENFTCFWICGQSYKLKSFWSFGYKNFYVDHIFFQCFSRNIFTGLHDYLHTRLRKFKIPDTGNKQIFPYKYFVTNTKINSNIWHFISTDHFCYVQTLIGFGHNISNIDISHVPYYVAAHTEASYGMWWHVNHIA